MKNMEARKFNLAGWIRDIDNQAEALINLFHSVSPLRIKYRTRLIKKARAAKSKARAYRRELNSIIA